MSQPIAGEPTDCECGTPFTFDPLLEGETCGGQHRIGWLVCRACGATCVTRRGYTGGGKWAIASSGRSLIAEGVKLRPEKGDADPADVLARIVRLPDLEAALRTIARGDGPAAVIARRALEIE